MKKSHSKPSRKFIIGLLGLCTIGVLCWNILQFLTVDADTANTPIDCNASRLNAVPIVSEAMAILETERKPMLRNHNAVGSVAASPLLCILSLNDAVSEDARVRGLQELRGGLLTQDERERALAFLMGKNLPERVDRGTYHWVADELLTVLQLQKPPQQNLSTLLEELISSTQTDPVIRDYAVQHLGQLWELYGPSKEIEAALWKAVGSADQTTPGSALIALSRGYQRDEVVGKLAEVRRRALEMAENPSTSLAARVSALSIAGEAGGEPVKLLAARLVADGATPVILRKVAERALSVR